MIKLYLGIPCFNGSISYLTFLSMIEILPWLQNNKIECKICVLPNESLSREEALMGITIWAAKAGFMDDVIGSLEVNKKADFIV
jgi:imidazolonepropionase-like amidohydrolase